MSLIDVEERLAGSDGPSVWSMVLTLLLVLGLIVFMLYQVGFLGYSDRDVLVEHGCVVDDSMCLSSPCVVPVYCENVSLCLHQGSELIRGGCGE